MATQDPRDTADLPERGSRWRNPRYRNTYTVVKVGPKYVTVRSSAPMHGELRFTHGQWRTEGWVLA